MPIQLSEKRTQLIVWTLLCLMPMVGMAVDLIAPSLPAIGHNLHVTDKTAKNVIAIYLLGYALGNFFTGFLSDIFGRQKLIRIGLSSFVVASVIPVFFPHIEALLIARLLQGISMGSVAVLARAIFSDVLPAEKLIRLGPLIGAMWGLGPVIGPVIGGYLQFYFNWQAGFCFFSAISFLGLIATFIIVPETHFNRNPFNWMTIKNSLVEVFTHRTFIAIVLLMGLAYSLIIAFNTAAPFLIQKEFHYSSVFFGHLALWLGLTFLSATFICRYLLKKYQVEQLFFTTINLYFLIAVISVMVSYLFSKSMMLITITSILMFFFTGFIFPLSMGKGMSLFRHIAGAASATMYLINILITSLTSFIVSFVHVENATTLIWIYFLLVFLCFVVYWGMLGPYRHRE